MVMAAIEEEEEEGKKEKRKNVNVAGSRLTKGQFARNEANVYVRLPLPPSLLIS